MKYRSIEVVSSGISLAQGCMMLNHIDDVTPDFEILDRALAQGINTFDNGHVYGGGLCDVIFGKWVRARQVRDQVIIIGKGAHHNNYRKRVTPFDVAADIADTIARMQVESSISGCSTATIRARPLAPWLRPANGQLMMV